MQLQLTLSTSTKQCRRCGKDVPLSEFSKDRGQPDGLFLWCKPCSRTHSKQRYNESPDTKAAHREAVRRWRARSRGEAEPYIPTTVYRAPRFESLPRQNATKQTMRIAVKAFNHAIRASVGCQVCGEREVCCLDFHHIDPTEKRFTLGRINRALSDFGSIINEVIKCTCLCANCHRKVHSGLIRTDDLNRITREQIEQAVLTLELT